MLTLVQSFSVENKKGLIAFMGLLFLILAFSIPLFSASAQLDTAKFPFKQNVTNIEGGVKSIVDRIAEIAGLIIMAISVLMILWSAFLFLTAGQNPDNVTKARNTLIFALVGIAVALLAFALPVMIRNIFAGR